MSRSNNHHCTPDVVGEQKGEYSPFFHIMRKEDWRRILFSSSVDSSFFSEKELNEFSTFFHVETQQKLLSTAEVALGKRVAIAKELEELTLTLSSALSNLATHLSKQPIAKDSLIKECAALSIFVMKKESEIRTNILNKLNRTCAEQFEESTFLQIKKSLLFIEAVKKSLGVCPPDWEMRKQALTQYPPQALVSHSMHALGGYEKAETLLSSSLTNAVKTAKARNHEKYANILHQTTVQLYDIAESLKTIKTEELYV
ncbi:MAG: hypothetical protein J6B12_02110 [Clostridia bacterium]|nr:hypothetical protein [Clostridia bacterium]